METDYTGSLYVGITLQWNYPEGYVDISMPKYVQKNLVKYKHEKPKRPQHCPYEPAPRKYGKEAAEDVDEEESPAVGEKDNKYIQQVPRPVAPCVASERPGLRPLEKQLRNEVDHT